MNARISEWNHVLNTRISEWDCVLNTRISEWNCVLNTRISEWNHVLNTRISEWDCFDDTGMLLFTDGTLYGPMHSQQGVDLYLSAIEEAKAQGGKIECGGKVKSRNTVKLAL